MGKDTPARRRSSNTVTRKAPESPVPPPTTRSEWRPRWWVELTTIVSFLSGLAGLVHEVLSQQDRPYVLAACVFLMTGAWVLRIGDKRP